MHVIRFRLQPAAWQKDELDKRFRTAWHIHNETAKYAQKCLNKLRNDRQYLNALAAYSEVSKKLKSMSDKRSMGRAAARHKRELILQKKEAAAILHEKSTRLRDFPVEFRPFCVGYAKENAAPD